MYQMRYKHGKIALVENSGTIQNNKRAPFMPGKHSEMMEPLKCLSSPEIKMELLQLQEPSIGLMPG